jgi:hypothetical protein
MIGVYDLCAALIFCLKNQTVDNKIYEIFDNIDYKIKDIDKLMKSVIGHKKNTSNYQDGCYGLFQNCVTL